MNATTSCRSGWSKAALAAIGMALMPMEQGLAQSEASVAATAPEISEEALTEALNATAKELGWDARASVTRTAGPGQHVILQVYGGSASFDVALYDSPDPSREAHEKGFAGKENRRFDFHGLPAVEAVYPAGSRGPIHGLMLQMGRASFRVTVRKPEAPDAAAHIAEIFHRHAMERGLILQTLQGETP
ncbi:MAG: hypothetical protein AB7V14_01600 [Kiritimatiellia bacterium]